MSGMSLKKEVREAQRKAKQQRKQQRRNERKQATKGITGNPAQRNDPPVVEFHEGAMAGD